MNAHTASTRREPEPPETIGYVLEMLLQLASLALSEGEEALAGDIVQTIERHAARIAPELTPFTPGTSVWVTRA